MKKLYFVQLEDEDIGEAGGVLDESGKVLDGWSDNDACWRNEFFEGFMGQIGFECIESFDSKHQKTLKKWLKEEWGL